MLEGRVVIIGPIGARRIRGEPGVLALLISSFMLDVVMVLRLKVCSLPSEVPIPLPFETREKEAREGSRGVALSRALTTPKGELQ
jgi:hypothetical protein